MNSLALFATMISIAHVPLLKLATEPTMVRFPAKVVARAITFHMSSGWAKLLIHLPATRTNGTLENTLDPRLENQAKFQAWLAVEAPKSVSVGAAPDFDDVTP